MKHYKFNGHYSAKDEDKSPNLYFEKVYKLPLVKDA